MKRISTTGNSAISDDAPALTAADFKRAAYRVAGKPASKAQWRSAVRAQMGKQRISIMLDVPIIEHFKSAAGERGYQTLINDALRRVVEGAGVVSEVRLAVRQELAEYKVRPR